jgi:hypothetical protein
MATVDPAGNLVLTLMLAIMTDWQQRTLLTRFVPIMPGDAELGAKIRKILVDVDLVLPTAAALLADERLDRDPHVRKASPPIPSA